METIVTSLMTFSLADIDQDILFAQLNQLTRIDLGIANEIVMARVAVTNQRCHYLIADVSNARVITAEAMDFMQSPEGGLKNLLGAAFIASNPVAALIANIFVKRHKDFPARFFSSRAAALAWVRACRQKHLANKTLNK